MWTMCEMQYWIWTVVPNCGNFNSIKILFLTWIRFKSRNVLLILWETSWESQIFWPLMPHNYCMKSTKILKNQDHYSSTVPTTKYNSLFYIYPITISNMTSNMVWASRWKEKKFSKKYKISQVKDLYKHSTLQQNTELEWE